MKTTWLVKKVTETEDSITASIVQGDWFKPNPAYAAMMNEYDAWVEELGQEVADRKSSEQDQEWIEEFIDAQPNEEDAFFVDGDLTTILDMTDSGVTVHPGDTIVATWSFVSK